MDSKQEDESVQELIEREFGDHCRHIEIPIPGNQSIKVKVGDHLEDVVAVAIRSIGNSLNGRKLEQDEVKELRRKALEQVLGTEAGELIMKKLQPRLLDRRMDRVIERLIGDVWDKASRSLEHTDKLEDRTDELLKFQDEEWDQLLQTQSMSKKRKYAATTISSMSDEDMSKESFIVRDESLDPDDAYTDDSRRKVMHDITTRKTRQTTKRQSGKSSQAEEDIQQNEIKADEDDDSETVVKSPNPKKRKVVERETHSSPHRQNIAHGTATAMQKVVQYSMNRFTELWNAGGTKYRQNSTTATARMTGDLAIPAARTTRDLAIPAARITRDRTIPAARFTGDEAMPAARFTRDAAIPASRDTGPTAAINAKTKEPFGVYSDLPIDHYDNDENEILRLRFGSDANPLLTNETNNNWSSSTLFYSDQSSSPSRNKSYRDQQLAGYPAAPVQAPIEPPLTARPAPDGLHQAPTYKSYRDQRLAGYPAALVPAPTQPRLTAHPTSDGHRQSPTYKSYKDQRPPGYPGTPNPAANRSQQAARPTSNVHRQPLTAPNLNSLMKSSLTHKPLHDKNPPYDQHDTSTGGTTAIASIPNNKSIARSSLNRMGDKVGVLKPLKQKKVPQLPSPPGGQSIMPGSTFESDKAEDTHYPSTAFTLKVYDVERNQDTKDLEKEGAKVMVNLSFDKGIPVDHNEFSRRVEMNLRAQLSAQRETRKHTHDVDGIFAWYLGQRLLLCKPGSLQLAVKQARENTPGSLLNFELPVLHAYFASRPGFDDITLYDGDTRRHLWKKDLMTLVRAEEMEKMDQQLSQTSTAPRPNHQNRPTLQDSRFNARPSIGGDSSSKNQRIQKRSVHVPWKRL